MTDVAALTGLRVLVVEDEMMVSMLIEDMLSWSWLVPRHGAAQQPPPRRTRDRGRLRR